MDAEKFHETSAAAARQQYAGSIEAKLKVFFADRRTLPAGRIQFINLSPIRERFGPQWSTIAERADAMASTIINRSLSRVDLFIKIDELAYLVLFGALNEEEAQVKCGFIASEISRHLLGESGLDYAEIQTVVVNADAPRAGSAIRIDDIVAQVVKRADEKVARTSEAGETVSTSAINPSTPARGVGFEGLGFSYRPMWDVKRNALSTYICIPHIDRGPALMPWSGYEIAGGTEDPRPIEEIDLACLDRVQADLEALEQRNRKLLIGCPVHYETLRSSRRRLHYLERCGRLKETLRAFLILEVCGIPEDVPQLRVMELVAPLSPYSRARTVRVPIGRTKFESFQDVQVHALGVDLSETGRSESEIFMLYNRFVDAAGRAKLRTFVHGLRSLSLASAAVCAGFDYVDGDAVRSATDAPESVYRFRSVDLFRALSR